MDTTKTPVFIFIFLYLSSPTTSLSLHSIAYSKHCSHILPEPPFTTTTPNFTTFIPTLLSTYVSTADDKIISSDPTSKITANFLPNNIVATSLDDVFKLDATLAFRFLRNYGRRNLLNLRGGPKIPLRSRGPRFQLSGFWDSSTGQLCMVGLNNNRLVNGHNVQLDVVFKANYPNHTNLNNSLVVGSLESLNLDRQDGYFKPISVMGFSRLGYNYTLIKNEINVDEPGAYASLVDGRMGFSCSQVSSLANYFELSYPNYCDGRNCSLINSVVGFFPKFMSFNEIECSGDRMVRVALSISNVSDVKNVGRQPLEPNRTLVAEGAWSGGNTRLDLVACRILNFTDSPLSGSVGDCSIRVEFTLTDTLNLRNWSVITGRMWSKKGVGEPGYFDSIDIRGSGSTRAALPDMKYVYTEIERVKKFCAEKKGVTQKGKKYPDPFSQDLKFDMNARNSKGEGAWGKTRPVFVDDRFVQNMYPYFRNTFDPSPHVVEVNSTQHPDALSNVAYRISLIPREEFKVSGKTFSYGEKIIISAEGTYDPRAGHLCMIGCWDRGTDGNVPLNSSRLDCDIFINIQFPPSNSKDNEVVKGTIESKRDKNSDPLYFKRIDLSGTSLTTRQVKDVFWRLDFEITMVLISNTLACIFVGYQLFHVKRHPEVLPFISVVMLVVITLGHMIPLLLNMEAFFLSAPSKKTVLFGSGGWLEVNEVLVRVITMVAFLLEVGLLQMTWSARGAADETQGRTLQQSEKKVIYYCLPLYACGALVAWLVRWMSGPHKTKFPRFDINRDSSLTFWGDVKSFAGFVLDAFLLPQIMFNVFSDSSSEGALSVPYYIGTTVVRLLPHAYDLFRAHSSSWNFDPWYIYANPGMNYYSTAWDILISCLGLVFVIFTYLQQRFGGRWVFSRRFSKTAAYEMVPLQRQ